jgi:hypothetical protein
VRIASPVRSSETNLNKSGGMCACLTLVSPALFDVAQRRYITYIITTRRMTSGELLKYRNGLLMVQTYHDERPRQHLV